MILTAHQPVYLPWLGYFHKIALADEFIVFDQVQYQKRDWNNRNRIKGPNGEMWLTVPVKGKNHFEQKLCDVELDKNQNWTKKHWKSIKLNYVKAPFFKDYSESLEEIYSKEWTKLEDLTNHMLFWFLDILKIETKVSLAGDYNFNGQKSELVLDMCIKKNANIYIFGTEGENYADRESFQKENIKLIFQKYNHPTYPQLHGEFVSHLSVLDLLFNVGPESRDVIFNNNITRTDLL